MTKMTSEKVRGPQCIRLANLATQFWLIKDPFGENIFILNKKIQIWMTKNSIRILEGLINFIEDLLVRKGSFLESI